VVGANGVLAALTRELGDPEVLDGSAQDSPPVTIDTRDAAVLQHRRLVAEWRAAGSDHGEVRAPDSPEWTAVPDDTLMPLSGAGNRVARIVSCPMSPRRSTFRRTARELATLGASRVCGLARRAAARRRTCALVRYRASPGARNLLACAGGHTRSPCPARVGGARHAHGGDEQCQ
jgi:hypothetical protein